MDERFDDIPLDITVGTEAISEYSGELYRREQKILKARGLWERHEAKRAVDPYNWVQEGPVRQSIPYSVLVIPEWRDYLVAPADTPTNAFELAARDVLVPKIEHCPWDQVLQFRSDATAIDSYRRFARLARAIEGRSRESARDELERAYENYCWALRKHGIEGTIDTLKWILQWDKLASVGLVAIGSAQFLEPLHSLIAGGAVASGQVALKIAERKVAREEIKLTPISEIAYLHRANESLGG
ncbi:MAG: hypothetical protein AAFY57_17480 [Cyanobacteria bacterium J06642_2]